MVLTVRLKIKFENCCRKLEMMLCLLRMCAWLLQTVGCSRIVLPRCAFVLLLIADNVFRKVIVKLIFMSSQMIRFILFIAGS